MITPLEFYQIEASRLRTAMKEDGQLNSQECWLYQELQYRISVMQSLLGFCLAAPVTTSQAEIEQHWGQLRAYLTYLSFERKYKADAVQKIQNDRETAHSSLIKVIKDQMETTMALQVHLPDDYKKQITIVIGTVTPVWVQYRNSFLEISLQK